MLEAGDQLGFRVEPPDVLGIVGQARPDDLDGHLPADLGLEGAMDGPERSLPDALEEPIPAQGLAPELQGGVLPQDPLLQALQLG